MRPPVDERDETPHSDFLHHRRPGSRYDRVWIRILVIQRDHQCNVNTGTFAIGIAPVSTTEDATPNTAGTNDYVWGGTAPVLSSLGYSVGQIVGADDTSLTGYTGWDSGVTEAGYTVHIKNLGIDPAILGTMSISWSTTGDSSIANDYQVYSWSLTDATHGSSTPLASGTTFSYR
jgi:hypothetical protein